MFLETSHPPAIKKRLFSKVMIMVFMVTHLGDMVDEGDLVDQEEGVGLERLMDGDERWRDSKSDSCLFKYHV